MEAISGKPSGELPSPTHIYQFPTQLPTPPNSISGSPIVKTEEFTTRLIKLHDLISPRGNVPVRLPSLEKFEQGVEALIRANGPLETWTSPSPLYDRSVDDSASGHPTSRQTTNTSPGQNRFAVNYSLHPRQGNYGTPDKYLGDDASALSRQDLPDKSCYPSPSPEGKKRHLNQKYTTEQGDYIIYAWHDKKMKWQRIKQEFAARFNSTPERTVQGLQAWYYRMNQRVPMWERDGRLCFDNEDDLQPRYVSIKSHGRDSLAKFMEPFGIAQRYPERAVHYSWVDSETKSKARDWAARRALQYRERREGRERREWLRGQKQRRLELQ